MESGKVFCLGFQKTGTSSLGQAPELLGYRVAGYRDFRGLAGDRSVTMEQVENLAYALAGRYDAFKDTPWPLLYEQMDKAYPQSKFIPVVRNPAKWIRSAVDDFGCHKNQIHKLIYGVEYPLGNEEIWISRYLSHNHCVQEYFSTRPNDLLTLDLDKGEVNWGAICDFLNVARPLIPWPHANKIREKKAMLFRHRLRDRLRLKRRL